MEALDLLRAAGLKVAADGNTLLVAPESAITDELRTLIKAAKPAILAALAAEETTRLYDRGLQLLAEILAGEEYIPKPTIASLRKYFPPLTGALPGDMSEEKAAEWRKLLPYYRGLVEQLGRTGEVPQGLVRAVKVWEHYECEQAKPLPVRRDGKFPRTFAELASGVPMARWYQEAIAEWERIRDASRARLPKRSRSLPTPPPAPPRHQVAREFERLWAPPDPALTGFAVTPEHLQQRLQDPAYVQRYFELIGEPDEPPEADAPAHTPESDAA